MKFSTTLFLGLLASFSVFANESLEKELSAGLARLIPDVKVDSIRKAPINGLYEVVIGPDVIYMTDDASYVFKGEILDINARRNLTEDVRSSARVKLIKGIDKNEYIEFAAENMQDAIYVFTDVDCGYCRKLHQDVPELNSRGISVRYLAYPRAGVDSATGKEMSQVWCADDRQTALTASKNRESFEGKTCDDPVAEQHVLGQKMGVRGTPSIYLENGRNLPGYMPPEEIQKQLRMR